MTKIDHCEQIRLTLIANAAALQHCTRTAANLIPIPNTGRFVAIGTPAEVARLLEIAPAAPASADNPSTAGAALTDQEIIEAASELYLSDFGGKGTQAYDIALGRAVLAAQAKKAGCAAPVAQSTAGAAKGIDPNEQIKVDGFDYPTTYGDLARIKPETLWNRYLCARSCPDAKTAFLVARAIPFVSQEVIAAPALNPSEVPQPELYTCIDKGGEYELLGEARGAGMTKGSVVSVYRDTTTLSLFYRTVGDFGKRMMPVPRTASKESDQAATDGVSNAT